MNQLYHYVVVEDLGIMTVPAQDDVENYLKDIRGAFGPKCWPLRLVSGWAKERDPDGAMGQVEGDRPS